MRVGFIGLGNVGSKLAGSLLRIFDGDDGMVHLHGEFDPVTGTRIASRLNHAARRLHSADQSNVPKS